MLAGDAQLEGGLAGQGEIVKATEAVDDISEQARKKARKGDAYITSDHIGGEDGDETEGSMGGIKDHAEPVHHVRIKAEPVHHGEGTSVGDLSTEAAAKAAALL